jgi:bidirectional [NiFe] hydrogenase diaphorase subunit
MIDTTREGGREGGREEGVERAPLVHLTIDGRRLEAPAGSFVLQVARDAGLEIPTLCEDPALEPVGACRLCMVEVTHRDWKGWSGLMTSCLYPVAEGIEVSTGSPRVLEARRRVLGLLAARCPNSPRIEELAARHEVSTEGFLVDESADNCILCGLCTRVCEAYATSAIATIGRGVTKAVGSFAEAPPTDCVGCGACALICPTDNIPASRDHSGYRIWNRTFETALARVDRTRCIGCGSCEEACPFAVARVALHADGRRVATIPADHCRGCGACVGACPSGAIDQEVHDWKTLRDRLPERGSMVFACGRADLGGRPLPEGIGLTELPCTGRITTSLLLASLLRGGDGTLVLGRHQASCRLDGAEDPARERVEETRRALTMVGMEPERIRFAVPAPGPEGPLLTVGEFAETLETLGRNPLDRPAPAELFGGEGLDTDLGLLGWISTRSHLRPDGATWLEESGLASAVPGEASLFAGTLPYLSVLAGGLLSSREPRNVLRRALEVLSRLGIEKPGIQVAGCGPPAPHHAELFASASTVFALSRAEARSLESIGVSAISLEDALLDHDALPSITGRARVACDGSGEATRIIEALGFTPVDVGKDPLPDGFAFSPLERANAERRLRDAEEAGAGALLLPDPLSMIRWALITREGTWRSSRLLPVLAHELAWFAFHDQPLRAETLADAAARRAAFVEGRS